MAITLDEMKKYLRVDFTDDDALIEKLMSEAKNRCLDILRIEADKKATLDTSSISNFDMALMYCVAYTYEHREDCDYKSLNLTLRALLYADREERF